MVDFFARIPQQEECLLGIVFSVIRTFAVTVLVLGQQNRADPYDSVYMSDLCYEITTALQLGFQNDPAVVRWIKSLSSKNCKL